MKKNKDFFYLQYNKINWKNQEKTGINSFINKYIIDNVILKHTDGSIAVFDIGFGIGFFMKMLVHALLKNKYKEIIVEGCEPSKVNYQYLADQNFQTLGLQIYNTDFLQVPTDTKFNFITAIYVFPHFLSEDLEKVVGKAHNMLLSGGQFIFVIANEKYLEEKLRSEKDLFLESDEIEFNGKRYKEVLHYSDIPEIGKVIDYNREESLYEDLFTQNGFVLKQKEVLDDNGFVCTLFVFEKI